MENTNHLNTDFFFVDFLKFSKNEYILSDIVQEKNRAISGKMTYFR